MKTVLTRSEMQAADRHTIEDLGVPSLTLMERAGRAIAEEAEKALQGRECKRVLVCCGGGNNGGDGFVAARVLQEKGIDVSVVCHAEHFSADCLAVKEKYKGEIFGVPPKLRFGVAVDCLFGTGLSRPMEGRDALLAESISASGAFVLAADIPSGLNADNGLKTGACVCADETVTIGEYKQGLLLADGRDVCGDIVRADIGIRAAEGEYARLVEAADAAKLFPKRKSHSNKGSYGKVCLVAGSVAYSGAALLAARAALRAGAGYTVLCVPKKLFPLLIARTPEILLKAFAGEENHRFDAGDLDGILDAGCIVVGPGTGTSEEIYRIVRYLLPRYTGKLVLDADALNSLARYGADALKEKACEVIVTPHMKEFARLVSLPVERVKAESVPLAKRFAAEYGVTVLLKDNTSIVADRGACVLVTEGTPALAKGGSGDVLSGIVAALCAMQNGAFESAYTGSFLLGRAAREAEKRQSEYAVTASDVVDGIGPAIAGLQPISK